jgi:hypothetical protein
MQLDTTAIVDINVFLLGYGHILNEHMLVSLLKTILRAAGESTLHKCRKSDDKSPVADIRDMVYDE